MVPSLRSFAAGAALLGSALAAQSDLPAISTTFVVGSDRYTCAVEGDDVSVTANGVELPAERLRARGVFRDILDEDGAVVGVIGVRGRNVEYYFPPVSRRAYLGVDVQPLGPALAAHLDVDEGAAILVVSVTPGSPAEESGLQVHDVVTAIDGESPVTQDLLRERIAAHEAGDTMTLSVVRGGKERVVAIGLGCAPVGGDRRYFWPMNFTTTTRSDIDVTKLLTDQVDTTQAWQYVTAPQTFWGEFTVDADQNWAQSLARAPADESVLAERIDRLAERLERLEKLLEKLADK